MDGAGNEQRVGGKAEVPMLFSRPERDDDTAVFLKTLLDIEPAQLSSAKATRAGTSPLVVSSMPRQSAVSVQAGGSLNSIGEPSPPRSASNRRVTCHASARPAVVTGVPVRTRSQKSMISGA